MLSLVSTVDVELPDSGLLWVGAPLGRGLCGPGVKVACPPCCSPLGSLFLRLLSPLPPVGFLVADPKTAKHHIHIDGIARRYSLFCRSKGSAHSGRGTISLLEWRGSSYDLSSFGLYHNKNKKQKQKIGIHFRIGISLLQRHPYNRDIPIIGMLPL